MSAPQPQQTAPFATPDNVGSIPNQQFTPPAPKKSRLPLILGIIGGVFLFCIGLGIIGALVGGGSSDSTTTASSAPPATTVPAGAAPTTAPTGKWSEPDKGKVLFGNEFRTAKSGGFEILDARTNFKPGTELRMAAQFKEKAGATAIEIILSKVEAGGAERVVEKATLDLSSPDSNFYSTTLGTDTVAEGTYKVKYVRGATILAEGQFTLAATAAQAR